MFAFKRQKSKSYIINTVVCFLDKEKDVKKTVRRKVGKSFQKDFVLFLRVSRIPSLGFAFLLPLSCLFMLC